MTNQGILYTPERDKPIWVATNAITYSPIVEKTVHDSQEIVDDNILRYFANPKKSDGLLLNFNLIDSQIKLIDVLNQFFSKYFIEGINYEILSKLIFDFEKNKTELSTAKIGNKITKFNLYRRKEYDKFILNFSEYKWQILKVDCTFSRIYVEDERWKEMQFDFNFDEFAAYMYCKWIRSWLDVKEIHKWLTSQYHKASIAKIIPPQVWKPSSIDIIVNLEMSKAPIEIWDKQKVNAKKYKCRFPQINIKDDFWNLAVKKKSTIWMHWMQIDWVIIDWIPWEDTNILESIISDWVTSVDDWDNTFIRAIENWFITTEMELIWGGLKKLRKIKVTQDYTHKWNIWPDTWSLDVSENLKTLFLEDSEIKHDYELVWNNINIKRWLICWKVLSINWDVNLDWNIVWGSLEARNWNIITNWKVMMHSYVEVQNWEIVLEYAEFSRIVWKKIKIKHAIWCEIIWEEVEIEISNVNNFIIKQSLSITHKMQAVMVKSWDIQTNWRDTKIILLAKKEVIWDLKLQRKINKAIAYHESMKNIDPETLRIINDLNERAINFKKENEEDQKIKTEKIFIKLNAWETIWYTKMYLWDFEERFDLELINSKWEEYKNSFLKGLLDLFDDTQKSGKILLSPINIEQFSDEHQKVDMNFRQIKWVMEDEFAKHKIPENAFSYRNWIENRSWFRLPLLDIKEFKDMKLDRSKDHMNIMVNLDEFIWSIKNVSSWWLCIYMLKNTIWDDHIFYQKWDVAEVWFQICNQKFYLKMVIRCRLEDDDMITFWWQFVWVNRWMEDKISKAVNDLQRELNSANVEFKYDSKYK